METCSGGIIGDARPLERPEQQQSGNESSENANLFGYKFHFCQQKCGFLKENPDENPDLSGRPCNLPRKSARRTHSKNGIAGPINCDLLKMIWLVLQMVHFLVGGLEHVLFFPYIGNVIIPTDEFIFFRGVGSTINQIYS